MEEYVTHPLAPIWDENSRVLILGTMPSPRSRAAHFYYAHPRNRFWPVLAAVLGEEDPGENEGCRQLALRHGVALWDVLAGCRIRGASDAAIRDPEPNDLAPILTGAPIRAIFATGKTAAALYHKLIEPVTGRPILPLPSPSPANCAVSLPALIESYRQLLAFLPQGEEETA
ncbi:MAG TPA: DNA-deoxyinosine glycosylase [Candidatus Pygmaiobacter gallistercoris]|nr:DNA-deoxyinosine glycosylase [Candidatus Pygmaiobacter gallistercoris]